MRLAPVIALLLAAPAVVDAQVPSPPRPTAPRPTARPEPSPQPRPHGDRVSVAPDRIEVDDGDTLVIRWGPGEMETVRLLGIDTPETRHLPHDIPYDQPFGPEARSFARGVFAAATQVDLLRAKTLDPFGRTLAYAFVNGRNYSVLVVRARLAQESVSHFGDNGFPKEAADVLAAYKEGGPLPFEPPHAFRNRMRDLSRWIRERGGFTERPE